MGGTAHLPLVEVRVPHQGPRQSLKNSQTMAGEAKVANAFSTRPASGSSLRDGRRAPLAASPAVTAVQLQNSRVLAAASNALAAFRVNGEKPYGMQPAADFEPQVGKSGVARGKHLYEADMEASPIAKVTAVRLADSSAGQHALGAWAAAAVHTDRWAQL